MIIWLLQKSKMKIYFRLINMCYTNCLFIWGFSFQVSDGIIAPGYTDAALAVLKKKKNNSYCILEMDPSYQPSDMERKVLFGLTLEQQRNNAIINNDLFSNIVSEKKEVSQL